MSNVIIITIETDNSAFIEPHPLSVQTDPKRLKMEEVSCILAKIAAEMFMGNDDPAVQDRNGNTVGSIVWNK